MMKVEQFDKTTGRWVEAVPEPYHATPLEWLWAKLTGKKTLYGVPYVFWWGIE